MESIEVVVRQSLNTTAVKQNTPDTNVKAEILETTLNCDSVLQHWDTISQSIPPKYEYGAAQSCCRPMDEHSWPLFCKRFYNEL